MKEFFSFSWKGMLKYSLRKFKQQKSFCPDQEEMQVCLHNYNSRGTVHACK